MNANVSLSQSLTCPQGHVWQAPEGDGTQGHAATACPVCGDMATTCVNPTRQVVSSEGQAQLLVPGFELAEELGRGGMGVVYKARQLNPERLVALKLMRRNMAASDSSAARFRGESAAAARLEHPNIVRVYAVGETADNSYIALELIDGPSLATLISQDLPAQRDAAQLISTLARAVHYAHERQVIHRDLKPANVLIAADGTPKLTDFGLAKRLDADMGETATGEILGTVFYMAPEQAMGVTRNIGPACDVHALGVMLYEMLTGRRPYVGQDVLETLTLVASAEPVAPRRLNPQISLDLETICLKCLEKLPRDRYASAGELADELDRVLRNEPIRARPASAVEKAIKWSRRRPAAALAIAVAVLAPMALALGLLWHDRKINDQLTLTEQQRERAESNLGRTQDMIDELLDDVTTGRLAALPASSAVRTQVLDWTLNLCRELRVKNPNNLHLRWQTARAERQVADVERLLNRPKEAAEAYAAAVSDLRKLQSDFPRAKDFRRELATALNNQGLLRLATRPTDEDRHNYQEAVAHFRQLAAEHPTDSQYAVRLASSLSNLGVALQAQKDLAGADKQLREALAIREKLTKDNPNDPAMLSALAASEVNLGKLLYDQEHAAEAQALFASADKRLSQPLAEQENVGDVRHARMVAKHNLAVALAAIGDQSAAEKTLLAALEIEQSILDEFPHLAEPHSDRAMLEHTAAQLLAKRDASDALDYYRRAIATQLTAVKIADNQSSNEVYRDRLREHYQSGIQLALADADPTAAALLADEYAKVFDDKPADLVASAVMLAQCIPLASEIKGNDKIQDQNVADFCTARSLALVRQALKAGVKVEDLPKSVVAALRDKPEFQEIVGAAK